MRRILGFTIMTAIFLFLTIVAWGISFKAYQPKWSLTYAKSHLEIAREATDPSTALYEIMRAKEILELSNFPKEGNFDILVHSPKAELSKAWESLDNIIVYTESIQSLTDPYQINHAMEELRVRLNGFFERRWEAFSSVPFWNNLGYWSVISAVFWFLALVSSFCFLWVDYEDQDEGLGLAIVSWVALGIIAILAVVFISVPVFYTGVR